MTNVTSLSDTNAVTQDTPLSPLELIQAAMATTEAPYDPCLDDRYWSYFLASSLIVFFAGLIVILLLRLARYSSCCRRPTQAERAAEAAKAAQAASGGRNPEEVKIGCLTKLKWQCEALMSGQTVSGRILVSMSCLLSIGSLIIYLVDATRAENAAETCLPLATSITQQVDFAFNILFIFFFVIRFIAANDKLMFWLEVASFVDYFTIPPSFVGVIVQRQWLGLRFLRALRLMSFPDILQYLSLLRTSNSIRLAQLCSIFLSVTLAGSGFIHMVETTGDPMAEFKNAQELTYWEAVYFSIVTMSTVGYGDIYCETTIGRAFMVLYILGALAMFASFIPEMIEIFGRRQRYSGTYDKPTGVKHIVLCGHISYESVQNFLKDFLHEDRDNTNVKCLFLDNKKPDLELEALYKRHFTQVVFFRGTVMSTRDLERVKLHEADACLVLANPRSRDPDAQDAGNVMRVIAVKNYYEDIRVVVQLMRFNNKAFCMNLPSWQDTDQVICLAEMKLGFMAQGCLAPGFSTLLANLFVMRSYKKSSKNLQWQDRYLQGAGMEVYTGYFSSAFYGKTFPQAAEICYTKLKILLMAVAFQRNNTTPTQVVINPGNDVIIQENVKGFFMCQSEDEAKRALYYCLRCHPTNSNSCLIKPCQCGDQTHQSGSDQAETALDDDNDGGFLTIEKSKIKFNGHNGASTELDLGIPSSSTRTRSTSSHTDNGDSGHSSSSETLPAWSTGYPQPSGLLAIEGTEPTTTEVFDSTGLFHWCPKRPFDDCIWKPDNNRHVMDYLKDHVVLCLFSEKSDPLIGLCNFIMPLRTSTIKSEDLKPIVLLGDEEYIRREWSLLEHFPDVYVKPGTPLSRADLRMVRIHKAHMCVILTTNETNQDDLTLIDKEAILCSLNIKTMSFQVLPDLRNTNLTEAERTIAMLKSRGSVGAIARPCSGSYIPMLTELANDYNAQFLDQDDEDDPDTPLYMTQPFACGRAFAASVLDTLMSTTYFNSELLSLIRMLITGGATSGLEQQLAEGLGFIEGHHTPQETRGLRARCKVSLLPLSEGVLEVFNNGVYGNMFVGALRNCGILCMGLYRCIDQRQPMGNRYIITNPPAESTVLATDKVYCLEPFYLPTSGERSEGGVNIQLKDPLNTDTRL